MCERNKPQPVNNTIASFQWRIGPKPIVKRVINLCDIISAMTKIALTAFLLVGCLRNLEACHPQRSHAGDTVADNMDVNITESGKVFFEGVVSRKKRQIYPVTDFGFRDFFVMCMSSYRRYRSLDIRTVVEYTIDQTIWFQKSDILYCRSDTVACWQGLLFRYMNINSELYSAGIRCIRQYGMRRGRNPSTTQRFAPISYVSVPRPIRKRRQISNDILNERTVAIQLRLALPFYRGNIRSLIEFVKADTSCSPIVCNCRGINIPAGESCGETWYTRIGALTRPDSPFRRRLVSVLNFAISASIRQRDLERRQRRARQILRIFTFGRMMRKLQSTDQSTATSILETTQPKTSPKTTTTNDSTMTTATTTTATITTTTTSTTTTTTTTTTARPIENQ